MLEFSPKIWKATTTGYKYKMESLKQQLKELIIESLELEDITPEDIIDDEPLFVEGLGLDSIDALELGLTIKKEFEIKLDADSKDTKAYFSSINSLAEFISSKKN